MSETIQWEYRVKSFGSFFKGLKDDELETELNQWGEEGWEVTGFRVIEKSNQCQVIAKRLLTRDIRRQRSMP
jgi:hypothetical protein